MCHFLPGGRMVINPEHRKETEAIWNVPEGRIKAQIGHHTVLMFEKFCTPTEKGGDISTLWVQVTNPGHSLPNLPKLFKAKAGLPDKFLIVSEVYPTATTELADLVLPSALWVEKNGMYGNSERRTQQWFRMVKPPGEARDDCWQTIAVARRVHDLGHPGMKDRDGKFLFTFKNDKGDNPARPDYRGDIMLGGVLYEVSGWIRPLPRDASQKFMSLSGKVKQPRQQSGNPPPPTAQRPPPPRRTESSGHGYHDDGNPW